MYATIRRYAVRDAATAQDSIDSLKRRIEKHFVPMIQDVQGFHCYYVVDANNRELVTISIFESAAGAQESTLRAAEFVRNDPAREMLDSPEVIEGDLLVSKEAGVGAR
jgi:hypothetical protein